MKLNGSYQINLEKQKVWEALNNPEILKKSIPGCEEFKKNSDTEFTATATNKIGPFNASFTGDIELKDINADFKIICIGKKGADVLKGSFGENVITAENINDKNSYDLAEDVSNELVKKLDNKEFGTCSVIYNQFKSVISQIVTEQSLIQCSIDSDENKNNNENAINFEFKPMKKEI